MAKQIKQQAANRWFASSKTGIDFKSPINWKPFQLEFTEQQKSQKQPSKKSRPTFNLFLCFKSSQKKYLFFFIAKLDLLVM